MSTQENIIHITKYVNPNMFFFKPNFEDPYDLAFQRKLDYYCKEERYGDSFDWHYMPDVGEVVAVFNPLLDEWFRCTVDEIQNSETDENRLLNLWAVDKGCSFQYRQEQVMPLPPKFQTLDNCSVQQGSVKNVLPMKTVYDREKAVLRTEAIKEWPEDISQVLRDAIESAGQIQFNNCVTQMQRGVLVYFGDLIIVLRNGKKVSVIDFLLSYRRAAFMEPAKFYSKFAEVGVLDQRRYSKLPERNEGTDSDGEDFDESASIIAANVSEDYDLESFPEEVESETKVEAADNQSPAAVTEVPLKIEWMINLRQEMAPAANETTGTHASSTCMETFSTTAKGEITPKSSNVTRKSSGLGTIKYAKMLLEFSAAQKDGDPVEQKGKRLTKAKMSPTGAAKGGITEP